MLCSAAALLSALNALETSMSSTASPSSVSIIVCIAAASIAASCSTFVNNGELSKLKVCIWRPYCVFLHSGERDHVADLLTLKAKWFATLT